MIKYLFIALLFNSILNSNGLKCIHTNPLNGATYDLNPMFNSSKVRYAARTSDVGYDIIFISTIFFDLCTDKPLPECVGNGSNVCQRLNRIDNGKYYNTYDLGDYYSSSFNSDGVTIRYKAQVSNLVPITDRCYGSYESGKRVNVVVVSSTQPQFCYYQIYLEGKIFCDCEDCSQPHGKCYNGNCQCNQYRTGEKCDKLNIRIESITQVTSEGIVFLIGDFQYITPTFQVLIGDSYCTSVILINSTTIEISVPPKGEGINSITITDGAATSYGSPEITYEYPIPCLYNCSQPHGECNLFLGVCRCDSQTNGTGCEKSRIYLDSIDPVDMSGGTTYLYGYFGITTLNLFISIGGSECINISQINEFLIKCDIGAGSTGFKDVLIQDRDLTIKAINSFQYYSPISINSPKQCFNDCGGPNQGACLSSGCSCYSPWIGNDLSFFKREIIIDSDFSLIVESKDSLTSICTNNNDLWIKDSILKLYTISGFALLGIIVVIFVYYKIKYDKNSKSKLKISNNENDSTELLILEKEN
ncbi:hypothetical protein ACTFIY_004894 [Dictyostelium cf. discoideum]